MELPSFAFTIVPMTAETAKQVAEIEAACFAQPWSYEAFFNELKNPMAKTWVALTADKTVAGFLNAGFVLDEGSLNNIAVLEAYRRQGAARLLLAEALQYCQSSGIRLFTLEVRKSNAGAIALYESFGFQQVGQRKNFYTRPTEDALLMTKFF